MDFNFAQSYIKEKPKSNIFNVLIPVIAIASIGGVLLMSAVTGIEMITVASDVTFAQERMNDPAFQKQYADATKSEIIMSQYSNMTKGMTAMDYVSLEKYYATTKLWNLLYNVTPESCNHIKISVLPDGSVQLEGSSTNVKDIALLEEKLRKSESVGTVIVNTYKLDELNTTNNVYNYNVMFRFIPLTKEEQDKEIAKINPTTTTGGVSNNG